MDQFSTPYPPEQAPSADQSRDVGPRAADPKGQHQLDGQRLAGLNGLDEGALRRLVATQPIIEQAKGMVMACHGVDADQAFALLRRLSSTRHVKLRDLCAGLVDLAAQPLDEPCRALRGYLRDT